MKRIKYNSSALRRFGLAVLMLFIALALLFFSFQNISFPKLVEQIKGANLKWITLTFLCSVLALVIRAYRWLFLLSASGNNVGIKNALAALSLGYIVNLGFPRLGEVSRCGYLVKSSDVSFPVSLGTVIIERIVDVISLVVCFLLIFLLEFTRIGDFMSTRFINPIRNKFSTSLIIAGAIILVISVILLFKFFKKENPERFPLHGFLQKLIKGLTSITALQNPGLFIITTFIIWILYYLSVYFCFFALSATSHLNLTAALFILVIGGIAMSAPVQGGIGIYHLLVSQGLVAYSINAPEGMAFAVLIHSLQLILILIFGIWALILFIRGFSENVTKKGALA